MKTTEDAMMNRLCFTVQYGLMVVFCLQVAGCETVDPPIEYSGMHPTDWPRKDFYFSPGDSLYMEVAQIEPAIAEVRFYFNDRLVATSLPQDGFASAIAVLPHDFLHAHAIGFTAEGTEFGRLDYDVKFNTLPKIVVVQVPRPYAGYGLSLDQVFPSLSSLVRSVILRAGDRIQISHPVYSPDSHYIAFARNDQIRRMRQVWVATFEGRRVFNVSGDQAIHFEDISGVTWMSDGSKILFAAQETGSPYALYMIYFPRSTQPVKINLKCNSTADATCSSNYRLPLGDPTSSNHVFLNVSPFGDTGSDRYIARLDIATGTLERILEGSITLADISYDGQYFTIFGDIFGTGIPNGFSGALYDRSTASILYPRERLGLAAGFFPGEYRSMFTDGPVSPSYAYIAVFDPVTPSVEYYYTTSDRQLSITPRARPARR